MTLFEAVLWLTLNVYHEARSEPPKAKMAVALVTLNRAKTRNLTIKEVVLEPNQFSWTSDKSLLGVIPTNDIESFQDCFKSVLLAVVNDDFTKGATYYHHKRITPDWKYKFKYVGSFGGKQRFYKTKPKICKIKVGKVKIIVQNKQKPKSIS